MDKFKILDLGSLNRPSRLADTVNDDGCKNLLKCDKDTNKKQTCVNSTICRTRG